MRYGIRYHSPPSDIKPKRTIYRYINRVHEMVSIIIGYEKETTISLYNELHTDVVINY